MMIYRLMDRAVDDWGWSVPAATVVFIGLPIGLAGAFLLLLAGCSTGPPLEAVGTERPDPFDGANTVFVETTVEEAAAALTLDGWTVDEQGASTLTTDWRRAPGYGYDVRINAAQQGERVAFRGRVRVGAMGEMDVQEAGASGSIGRTSFDYFHDTVRGVGEPVLYARR